MILSMLCLMIATTYLMIVALTWDQKLRVMNVFAPAIHGLVSWRLRC
jgi:hypothetical protein